MSPFVGHNKKNMTTSPVMVEWPDEWPSDWPIIEPPAHPPDAQTFRAAYPGWTPDQAHEDWTPAPPGPAFLNVFWPTPEELLNGKKYPKWRVDPRGRPIPYVYLTDLSPINHVLVQMGYPLPTPTEDGRIYIPAFFVRHGLAFIKVNLASLGLWKPARFPVSP